LRTLRAGEQQDEIVGKLGRQLRRTASHRDAFWLTRRFWTFSRGRVGRSVRQSARRGLRPYPRRQAFDSSGVHQSRSLMRAPAALARERVASGFAALTAFSAIVVARHTGYELT
jgi:hypothetical protein